MLMMLVIGIAVGGLVLAFHKPNLRLDSSMTKPSAAGGMPATCPACGSMFAMTGPPGNIVRCNDCGAYAAVTEQRQLAALPASYVAKTTLFAAYLPEEPRWPSACAVCGDAATRRVKMSITYDAAPTADERLQAHLAVGMLSLGTAHVAHHAVRVHEKYEVPHCAAHDDGVSLAPAGVAFRSLAYQRQFIDLNRGGPGMT